MMIMVVMSVFISGPDKKCALSVERIKGKFSLPIHLTEVAEVTAIRFSLLRLVTEGCRPSEHTQRENMSVEKMLLNIFVRHFVEYTEEMQNVLRNAIIEDCK